MAIPYRTFASVSRLRIARPRSIAPLMRFYSEAASSAATTPTPAAATPEAPIAAADSAPAPAPAAPEAPAAPATPATSETPTTAATPATPTTPPTPTASPELQDAIATYKNARDPRTNPPPAKRTAYTKPASPRPAYKAKSYQAQPRPNPPKPNPPAATKAAKDAEAPEDDGTKPPVWRPNYAPAFKTKPLHENIDWVTSYAGLGTSPVSQSQFSILTQPVVVSDIELKPDGILYLPEIQYRRRLHEAFGPMGWGIVPRGDAVIGKDIVTREYALIVNGCFVSQAQGVNNYFSAESIPTAIEGAKSNALMRCCKDLGVASELWLPEYIRWYNARYRRSYWVEHATTKKKRIHYFKAGTSPDIVFPWKRV